MTMLHGGSIQESTSAGGPMSLFFGHGAIRLLERSGTSGLGAMKITGVGGMPPRPVESAPEVSASAAPRSAGSALGELRRLSGLTWDRLAALFEVDRRSLHFWASGKPMNAGNEERLHRLLGVLRKIDRGSAAANRAALLDGGESGDLPFDLLVRGEYDAVVDRLGTGKGRRVVHASPSAAEMARRAPRPPGELVDALQDPIHPPSGRLLSATSLDDHRRK